MEENNTMLTFENAMNRLEEIARLLESSGTSLDASLELYKEGIELIKFCNSRLDDAQQKITLINKGEQARQS